MRLFDAGLTLYGADDPFRTRYLDGTDLEITEDRDASDYLYLRQDLAELHGHRYHKKKNRLDLFTRHHPHHRVVTYCDGCRDGCLQLVDAWLQRHADQADSASLLPEAEATREALLSATLLGLEGVVVLVEGTVAAFALGERLNRETAVCHFEKNDPQYEGLAQLVDRDFNRLLFTDCTYVNREQDLGAPGLRAAKLSYHPVELVRKYRARRTKKAG